MSDTQNNPNRFAPNGPGIPARWTSSAKTGLGTALSNQSRVWFTLSHGIFNEIYYPRIDQACIRDIGLIVTDGVEFFSIAPVMSGSALEGKFKPFAPYRDRIENFAAEEKIMTCHEVSKRGWKLGE